MPNQKDNELKIRIDAEMARQAKFKAAAYGGLSVVIRALLRAWLDSGRVTLTAEDILREHNRAPKSPRKKKTKAR